jgi:catechol 2,3-dioxygenase-like lactoylglutathione lyase family enzyme
MPKYWFDHIHLISPDPVKTADFYEKTFGAKKSIKDLGGGRQAVSVDLAGTKILIRGKNEGEAEKPSLDHYGIQTDNLEQAVADLKKQGVVFTMEIRQIRPDMKISFLRTPDGVSIELQQGSL